MKLKLSLNLISSAAFVETTLQVSITKLTKFLASESGLKTVKIASVGSDAGIWNTSRISEQAKSRPKNRSTKINGGVPLNESVANGTGYNAFNQSVPGDLAKPLQTNSFQLVLRILNQWGFTLKGKITKRPTKRCESGNS